jgi:hypothetical protein
MLGVGEPTAFVSSTGAPEYKLGGAGLGLAALTSLAQVSPGAVPASEMRGLARFGQYLLTRDGEFYPKYSPTKGGRIDLGDGVLYYPGEMALGWLMLYESDPSPDLIASTVAALSFLARERAAASAAPADHWALLATARLFRLADRDGTQIPRQLLFNHALQICHTMLEDGYGPPTRPVMEGSLVSSGRGNVTPTSTRLEALLAALSFLPADHPLTPHVASAVHRGMGFVLRSQVKDGAHEGGIPQAIETLPPDGTDETDKFNRQATEIRIDYVQHALSAMVQYLTWRATRPG